MPEEPHAIDYATPRREAEPISAPTASLTCAPGLAAVVIYVAHQHGDVPNAVGYVFWVLALIGIVVGAVCLRWFRRTYRGRVRPWFISFGLAVHTLALLAGVPLVLLMIGWALSGSRR